MRLLFYQWNSYLQYDIEWICRENNIELKSFSWTFQNKNVDDNFEKWFLKNIDGSRYDAVLSVNYWPMLSKMAQKTGLKYIAWCYDNPLNVLDIEVTLANPVNHVFFFDRIQAKKYTDAGFDTVHYLTLGVNRSRLSQLKVTGAEQKRFGADVSLVGSLYESRIGEVKQLMDEHDRGYVDAAMAVQQDLYGCYLFDEMITDEFIAGVNAKIHSAYPETEFVLLKEALTFAMASDITRKDRLIMLTMLGRRFDTHLYSFQTSEILQGVKCHPVIDYVTEMPKVFQCSRINLNPTLRCIQSGIPLRALDIMAAGGFLLSNYQPELVEQFAAGEEMDVYESLEDAVEKAAFYLQHDEIRKNMIVRGRNKVLEQFALQDRLEEILKIVGLMK